MKIGLYFGSFNPIHIGHMAIANYMVEFTDLERVWFVVSPQNPFKDKKSLLGDHHRLALVEMAIEDDFRFKASNIEFHLPQPSYTVDTLAHLQEKYPEHEFVLIMGEDNLKGFSKWKNYEFIGANYPLYVYPRSENANLEIDFSHLNLQIVRAPKMEISSSFIRQSIFEKKDIRHFLPKATYEYLDQMNFYKQSK